MRLSPPFNSPAIFRYNSFSALFNRSFVFISLIILDHLFFRLAYVEQRFDRECSSQIQTYGDIIRRHRDEHAIDWLTGAAEMATETEDVSLVLQCFLRLENQPA